MKFAFTSLSGLVLAGLLSTTGMGAMAQGTDAAPAPMASGGMAPGARHAGPAHGEHRMDRMGRHDPARMQAWMAKRHAELKTRLNITPAQEGAWSAFTAAMQPPTHMMRGEQAMAAQRAELDKLTTPERIDKMKALRTQRMAEMNAEMDRRGAATKALYAALSPEQQKIFDAEHQNMGGHRGHHGGGMHHKD